MRRYLTYLVGMCVHMCVCMHMCVYMEGGGRERERKRESLFDMLSSKYLLTYMYTLSTSLGIGLFITFKVGELMLRWLWVAVAQWSEHLHWVRSPAATLGFFFLF